MRFTRAPGGPPGSQLDAISNQITSRRFKHPGGERNSSRHEIEFLPWERHFLVLTFPPNGEHGDGTAPTCAFKIHETKPDWWEPLAI